MQSAKVANSRVRGMLTIAAIIITACFMLFSLDKDTHHFFDLLKPENLVALAVYFLPTFFICALLYWQFQKKHSTIKSITRSLLIGIPLTFTLVIVLLIVLKPR